ncbi:hypothetical protein ABIB68_007284 [Bradyrhizobium sp. F1.2.2]
MPEPDGARHDSYIARYRSIHDPHIIGIDRIVTGKRRDGTRFPMHLSIGRDAVGRGALFHRLRPRPHRASADPGAAPGIAVRARARLAPDRDGRNGFRARPRDQPAARGNQQLHEGSRRLRAGSTDPNTPKIESALDRASEQEPRAGQIIRRLRDFVSRGESEKRVESLSKLIEEAARSG